MRHEVLEARLLFAVVPAGFVENGFGGAIANPTAMEFAPDGRLFVAQQTGQLRVLTPDGVQQTNSFVALDVDSAGERGLLGVAFDPAFAANGFVYVYYTVPNGSDGSSGAFNRISRFTAVDADPGAGYAPGNTAAAGSEFVLLNLNPLTGATNHNGGAIHFGPDGKLYAAVGENATTSNAQTLANHHGKILRLNANGTAPADNPFNDKDATPNEPVDYIWALGLRNPFTTAFDPATGAFFINDVGAGTWEEINAGAAGANYGWPRHEGPETEADFATPPIFAYSHSAAGTDGGSVISGGTFYRPPAGAAAFPAEYAGDYFFADGGRGWIRRYDQGTGAVSVFATGASFPVDLKAGPDGALYYAYRGAGGGVTRVSTAAPRVAGVFVSGGAWTTEFKNHLAGTGRGDANLGLRIDAASQTDELPWSNLNRVSIRFSETVNVSVDDLAVRGQLSAGYLASNFTYDNVTFTATWHLANPLPAEKLVLDLDADGAGGVTDVSGNRLDGEWANPAAPAAGWADVFPSGNGVPNGDFRLRLNVLPGDANRNGSVSATDLTLVKRAQGAATGNALYTIYADVNGSGAIFANDVNVVRGRQGTRLPAGEPAGVTAAASIATAGASTNGASPGRPEATTPWRTFSVNDVSRFEGDTGAATLTFTVTLSGPAGSGGAGVSYRARHQTAGAGDYAARTGVLSFAAGQTSRSVSVSVKGDAKDEADETFRFELLGAIDAAIADNSGVGTIRNDD